MVFPCRVFRGLESSMSLSRRDVLAMSTAAVTAIDLVHDPPRPPSRPSRSATRSTPAPSAARKSRSTRRRSLAAKAGYNAIEPWIVELQDYVKKGGNLKDLGKQIADLGPQGRKLHRIRPLDRGRRPRAAEGPGRGEARHGNGAGQSAALASPPRRPGQRTSRSRISRSSPTATGRWPSSERRSA